MQLTCSCGGKLENIAGTSSLDDSPQPDDVALLLHTSGTTSRPKGVPLRHRNLVAGIKNVVDAYALGPDDRSLLAMPLFHIHGIVAGRLPGTMMGLLSKGPCVLHLLTVFLGLKVVSGLNV